MRAAAVPTTHTTALPLTPSYGWALSQAATTTIFIVAVMALAFGLRVAGLSTSGFSEDEINKVRAIEAYRQGSLSANAEHPMLMKLAMLTSVEAASAWNRVAPTGSSVAIETAIRLPNALVGAATTAAIFGATQVLFGTPAPATSVRMAAEAMIAYLERETAAGVRASAILRHVVGLFHHVPGARAFRRHVSIASVKPGAGAEVLRDALSLVSTDVAAAETAAA